MKINRFLFLRKLTMKLLLSVGLFLLGSQMALADAPQFLSEPEDCLIEGDDFLYQIDVIDLDGEPVTVTVDGLPSFLQFNDLEMVSTVIGGQAGYVDGSFSEAQIGHPGGIIFTHEGDIGYLADYDNHVIRKLDFINKEISTYVGSVVGYQDGPLDSALLNLPSSMTLDSNGNIYLTEHGSHRIRKIDTVNEVVSTIAGSGMAGDVDGIGTGASLQNPVDITIDEDTNTLYFADAYNHKIKKVDLSNNQVTTIAGSSAGFADGIGGAARFNYPYGLDLDPAKENLYIADSFNNRIRRIQLSNSQVTTIAGSGSNGNADGIGTAASFSFPYDLEFHPDGSAYITDYYNNLIRKIDVVTNEVTTYAGSTAGLRDGELSQAQFNGPSHLIITDAGDIFVSDRENIVLRKIKREYFVQGGTTGHGGEYSFSLFADDNHGSVTEQEASLRIGQGIFLSQMQDISLEIPADENEVVVNWAEPSVEGFCGDEITDATVTSNFQSGDSFPLGTTEVVYEASKDSYSARETFEVTVFHQPQESPNPDPTPTPDPQPNPQPSPEPEEVCSSSIGNIIWLDNNHNQKKDLLEKGIEDITVKLKDQDGNTIKKDKTNSRGKYKFKDLDQGTYTVVVSKKDTEYYIQTYDPSGSKMNNKATIKLGCHDKHTKADFGFSDREASLAQTGGVIQGLFFNSTGWLTANFGFSVR